MNGSRPSAGCRSSILPDWMGITSARVIGGSRIDSQLVSLIISSPFDRVEPNQLKMSPTTIGVDWES